MKMRTLRSSLTHSALLRLFLGSRQRIAPLRKVLTVAWLENATPTDTTQALSLWLLLDIRSGRSAERVAPRITQLLGRQKADGGWSQLQDLPCDAYSTVQALGVFSVSEI